MYPLNPTALQQAQSTRRRLKSEYRNALVVDTEHGVRRVEVVEVLGPLGASYWQRLLSRLVNVWSIRVRISEPNAISFGALEALATPAH